MGQNGGHHAIRRWMVVSSGRALGGRRSLPSCRPPLASKGNPPSVCRPSLASKGNPRVPHSLRREIHARSSDAAMVDRSQRPCPSLTRSAGRARRWLSPSPTAGKRSDGRTTSWRRTLPARLSSMSWARGFAAVSNGNGPLLLLPTCNNLARWQQQCLHAYGQVRSSVCSGSVRVLTPV